MEKRKTDKWWQSELNIATKAEVMERVRSIVAKHRDGQVLNPFDETWMLKILRHHYDFQNKVNGKYKHLEVRTNRTEQGSSRGFWIVRTNGSATDISWCVALAPGGCPSVKQEVASAARYEVRPQILEHHKHGTRAVCTECQLPMKRQDDLHVDHIMPFDGLLTNFIIERGLGVDQIEIQDLGLQSQFLDRDLGIQWQNFHRRHATLRIVHAKCNLSRKSV